MDWLLEPIRQILIEAILSSILSLFGVADDLVQDAALEVARTPQDWNAGIFNMVRGLSDTVIVPIAGIILTYVAVYEFIQMILQGNNFQNIETSFILKWIFKTAIAIFLLSNTFAITMAVFEMAQEVVGGAMTAVGNMNVTASVDTADFTLALNAMGTGELVTTLFLTMIASFGGTIMKIIVYVIVSGRIIQIYLTISLAPIPFATLINKEWGQIGQGYIKTILALAFQGFLIVVCLAIYVALAGGLFPITDLQASLWEFVAITALLCFMLTKTSSISNSIFNAH